MLFYVSGEMLTGVPRALFNHVHIWPGRSAQDGWQNNIRNYARNYYVMARYGTKCTCRSKGANLLLARLSRSPCKRDWVFVTSCRLNRVVVFGDPTVIKIRDLHGHICGKYKLCIFTQNLKAYKLDFDCNLPLLFFLGTVNSESAT